LKFIVAFAVGAANDVAVVKLGVVDHNFNVSQWFSLGVNGYPGGVSFLGGTRYGISFWLGRSTAGSEPAR
jgi:hypothetical protein